MYQMSFNTEEQQRNEMADLEVVTKLLEIYDQTFLADYLNQLPNNRWTRETINRWVKVKLRLA